MKFWWFLSNNNISGAKACSAWFLRFFKLISVELVFPLERTERLTNDYSEELTGRGQCQNFYDTDKIIGREKINT